MQGQLERIDGRWQLRFTRKLAHPPEKVWRALTELEHLAAWFPTDIEGERAPGAELRFVFRNGEGPTIAGKMITVARIQAWKPKRSRVGGNANALAA